MQLFTESLVDGATDGAGASAPAPIPAPLPRYGGVTDVGILSLWKDANTAPVPVPVPVVRPVIQDMSAAPSIDVAASMNPTVSVADIPAAVVRAAPTPSALLGPACANCGTTGTPNQAARGVPAQASISAPISTISNNKNIGIFAGLAILVLVVILLVKG